ncbi:MAG: DNA polymerase III subunit beta [Candidatus Stahlbacteria bacterium]|nr:DNA polymerase III subunit beta [Candidatus Stahlbacteria bacterium]
MEFKSQKTVLDTLLSKVNPIIPTRSTLPTLLNVLLEAKKNKLYVSATDLETSVTAIGGIETQKDGGIALNGKDLYNITRELPLSDFDFRIDNLLATIQCEKGKFSMSGVAMDEYPTLMEVDKSRKLTIPYTLFQRAIDKTLFATASTDTEGPLGGVLLDLHQNEFRLVATDGHKLAMYKKKIDTDKIARLLVASKVWREVAKFSSGVEIAFEENKIGFYGEDILIVSRLLEREFPPYESVIPTENNKILSVSKEALSLVLRRVLVFAPEISRFVKFIISPDSITIETNSETGEAKEEVPCKYDADKLEVAYNGSYLLSIMSKIDGDEVKFLFKDHESAALISPIEQQENEEILYLLMPIRLE